MATKSSVQQKFRMVIDPQSLVPNDSIRKYYWWSLLVTILIGTGLAIIWKYLPQTVPLFFTEPWGEARLVPKLYLILLPIIALLVTAVNILIAKIIPNEFRTLNYLLGINTLVVSVILMISLYGIAQSLL